MLSLNSYTIYPTNIVYRFLQPLLLCTHMSTHPINRLSLLSVAQYPSYLLVTMHIPYGAHAETKFYVTDNEGGASFVKWYRREFCDGEIASTVLVWRLVCYECN
jgi:hypothetical protein